MADLNTRAYRNDRMVVFLLICPSCHLTRADHFVFDNMIWCPDHTVKVTQTWCLFVRLLSLLNCSVARTLPHSTTWTPPFDFFWSKTIGTVIWVVQFNEFCFFACLQIHKWKTLWDSQVHRFVCCLFYSRSDRNKIWERDSSLGPGDSWILILSQNTPSSPGYKYCWFYRFIVHGFDFCFGHPIFWALQ